MLLTASTRSDPSVRVVGYRADAGIIIAVDFGPVAQDFDQNKRHGRTGQSRRRRKQVGQAIECVQTHLLHAIGQGHHILHLNALQVFDANLPVVEAPLESYPRKYAIGDAE